MHGDPSRPPLSRRGLFSLAWARPAPRPDLAAYRRVVHERWEGAAPLLAALAPLAAPLCDAAALEPERRALVVAAGDGEIAFEAARRGAVVSACEDAGALLELAEERAGPIEVNWDPSGPEDLPFFDGAFHSVIAGLGAAFVPRPVRMARELLRVLLGYGTLVLAAPAPDSFLARALELSLPHDGVPSAAAWGREEVARGRLDTADPGVEAEAREVAFDLVFESETAAWEACSGPLGIPPDARGAFADLVASRSQSRPDVRIGERTTLVVARR